MTANYAGNMTLEGSVESLDELLAGLVGTAATLHLYKAGFSPNAGTKEADFETEEADFSGYAAQAMTFGPVGTDAAGQAASLSDRILFTNSTGTVPNSIGGAWMSVETAAGPPAVVASVKYFVFPTPIPLNTALATLGAVVVVQLPTMEGYAIIDN